MSFFEIVQDGGVTASVRHMDSGVIELVRKCDHGVEIHYDSPQNAIHRWTLWALGVSAIADGRAFSPRTGSLDMEEHTA